MFLASAVTYYSATNPSAAARFPAADPIGVVLTILQWMLLGPALRAYAIRRDDTR
jgi:hypothetical protein